MIIKISEMKWKKGRIGRLAHDLWQASESGIERLFSRGVNYMDYPNDVIEIAKELDLEKWLKKVISEGEHPFFQKYIEEWDNPEKFLFGLREERSIIQGLRFLILFGSYPRGAGSPIVHHRVNWQGYWGPANEKDLKEMYRRKNLINNPISIEGDGPIYKNTD